MNKKKIVPLLLMLVIVFNLFPAAIFAGEAPPEQVSVEIEAAASTYTRAGVANADTPQQTGPASWFAVWRGASEISGSHRNGYIKFDISGLGVEDAHHIQDVSFTVYGSGSSGIPDATILVFGADNSDWDYSVTWNTAPAHLQPPLDQVTTTSDDPSITFDITNFVKYKIASGETSFTLVLTGKDYENKQFTLSGTTAAAHLRPQINILASTTGSVVQPLDSLNDAATAAELREALEMPALGLSLESYNSLTETKKELVAAVLLNSRPDDGYSSVEALQAALDNAVNELLEPPGNQLKNLPPVAPGEKRFNLADYDVWPLNHGDAAVALWQDDKTGAFSFSIDDNYEAQHGVWLELIEEFGFDLTWFVITGNIQDSSKWEALISAGQDIQSHTVNHLTNGDAAPIETIAAEYANSQAAIDALQGGSARTIAYPYGNGNIEVAAEYYIGGRGVVGLPNYADNTNYMMTNALSIRGTTVLSSTGTGNSVEDMVKTVFDPSYRPWGTSYYRGWTNLFTHSLYESGTNPTTGQTENSLSVSRFMFEMLKEHEDHIWVAPFTDVAMYGQQRDTAQLIVLKREPDLIEFNLTDQMDDGLFDYPLTVKVRVNNDWSDVAATQNGDPIPLREVTHEGQKYVMVKAVPDRGTVSLVNGSQEPSADVTTLAAKISQVQAIHDRAQAGTKIGQYPEAAKANLDAALTAAKAVQNSGTSDQTSVDAAAEALETALQIFSATQITLAEGTASISIHDLTIIARYFGITSDHPDWDKVAAADLADNSVITIEILADVAKMILNEWLFNN